MIAQMSDGTINHPQSSQIGVKKPALGNLIFKVWRWIIASKVLASLFFMQGFEILVKGPPDL